MIVPCSFDRLGLVKAKLLGSGSKSANLPNSSVPLHTLPLTAPKLDAG